MTALVNDAADVAVIEVADGLFQEETAAIAAHSGFRAIVSACVFAAGDSVGAVAGTARLADLGYTLAAISGLVTRSPLGMREAATAGLPVLTAMELADPVVADRTFAPYSRRTLPDGGGWMTRPVVLEEAGAHYSAASC